MKMDNIINVLIFPAGEINSVELHDALSNVVNIKVFGASSVDRHGPYIFRNYYGHLPIIDDPSFINEFNKLIEKWDIDVVFPTHDSVICYFSEHLKDIHSNVLTPPIETAKICRDKLMTYKLFSDTSFCPQLYSSINTFPCFIKPRVGQGSIGAKIIKSLEDVPKNISFADYVISEYLPGEELTVDCLTDNYGNLRAILPRSRDRLLAGVSVAGTAVLSSDEINQIAETINNRLSFKGLWYFQIKKSKEGNYKLLEVSARCAGSMCLSRARGVNLPLMSVYISQGREIEVYENPFSVKVDRTLISRYLIEYNYQIVYIDYDDTIVSGEKVILSVIRFLYQCNNQGKKIVLISRHDCDHEDTLEDSMRKHNIPASLFNRIIKLNENEEKADYIDNRDAIFIDNAFKEREKIHKKIKIPTFDIEGIEVLTDWRC